jgi:hypothetical protein
MMLYSVIGTFERFFYLEDGSSIYLQNVGTSLPNYIALHVIRALSSVFLLFDVMGGAHFGPI